MLPDVTGQAYLACIRKISGSLKFVISIVVGFASDVLGNEAL